jgi:Putative prokaryotic signal transducing protein
MDDDWVEVRSCTFMHEALFLQSVLDGAGIETMIPNEHTIAVNPLWTNLLGGIRVMVRPADLARASELLDIATTPSEDKE